MRPQCIQHDGGTSIAHRIHWTRAWGAAACGLACLLSEAAWTQQPLAGAATAIATQSAQAQPGPNGTGSIGGSVVDSNGTVYAGAHATLTAAGSDARSQNTSRTKDTDGYGRYNFTALAAGTYTLTISGSGFRTQTRTIALAEGQSYQAEPITLLVSSTSSVHVTASDTPIEIARAEVQLEEKQRVLGIIPNFFVAYDPKAPPLNTRLKFALAWKSAIDPVSFLGSGVLAGIEQAGNEYSGYGQGAQGYGKRFGAAYADGFIGNMFGNAIYPALLRQDPRFFYKGTGTIRQRALYAIASAVICKGDNGRWQPNYSAILGSLTAGGISNLYYPASNRNGAATTFQNAGLSIAGGALAGLFQEFVVKKLTPKLPNYGSGH